MEDRVRINSDAGGNGRSSKLKCPSTYSPTGGWTGFLADLIAGNVYVDINANNSTGADAGVSTVGTPLSKASLLQDSTALRVGGSASSTPNDVLGLLADQLYWNSRTVIVPVPAGGWSSTSGGAPYYKTIQNLSNVNANSNPVWDVYIPDGTATSTAQDMIDACSLVNKLVTGTNTVTLYCYQAQPNVAFNIIMKGAYGTWITS